MTGDAAWARIKFEPSVERAYAAHMLARIIPLGRLAFIFGGSAFAGYAFWDLLLDGEAWARTGPIRLAVIAFFAIGFALTFLPVFRARPAPWLILVFATYVVVALGFTLVLAQLDGGFVAGVPGFILGMIFVPVLVLTLTQAIASLFPLVVLPLAVMSYSGATPFALINAAAWIGGGAAFALGSAYLLDIVNRRAFELERLLDAEQRRSESLLLNILPSEIAERLKAGEETIADDCEAATVLFADLVGFTELSRQMPAKRLVGLLNDLYSRFDRLVEKHGVEKIKTIGDAYMVAAFAPGLASRKAVSIADLALDMRHAFTEFRRTHDLDLKIRIGIHSGPVVVGVIGEKKFAYDLWGDTVNIASPMESHGLPDEIQISDATRALLAEHHHAQPRGEIALKGYHPMKAFLLQPI